MLYVGTLPEETIHKMKQRGSEWSISHKCILANLVPFLISTVYIGIKFSSRSCVHFLFSKNFGIEHSCVELSTQNMTTFINNLLLICLLEWSGIMSDKGGVCFTADEVKELKDLLLELAKERINSQEIIE